MKLSTFAIPLALTIAVVSAAPADQSQIVKRAYGDRPPAPYSTVVAPTRYNARPSVPATNSIDDYGHSIAEMIAAVQKATGPSYPASTSFPTEATIWKQIRQNVDEKVRSIPSTSAEYLFNKAIRIPKVSKTFFDRILTLANQHNIGVRDADTYLAKAITSYKSTEERQELLNDAPIGWKEFIPVVDKILAEMLNTDFGGITGVDDNLFDRPWTLPQFDNKFNKRPPPKYISKADLVKKTTTDLEQKIKDAQTVFSLNPFNSLVAGPKSVSTLWDKVLLQAHANGIKMSEFKYLPRVVESVDDRTFRDAVVRGEPKNPKWADFDRSFLNILGTFINGNYQKITKNIWDAKL